MIGFLAAKIFGGSSFTAGIFLVASIAVTGYIGVLKIENWSQGRDIAALELQVKQLELDVEFQKGEVKACKAVVEQNNERIDDLRSDREARTRMFDLLQDNVDLIRERGDDRVNDLEQLPTPQNCEDAMQLLRDGLGERQ